VPDQEIRTIRDHSLWAILLISMIWTVMMVASQYFFRRKFEIEEFELPGITELALGWVPQLAMLIQIGMTAVILRWGSVQQRRLWEPLLVVWLGIVVGHHVIAMVLAFPHGHTELSVVFSNPQLT
jgi:hypothetical protein